MSCTDNLLPVGSRLGAVGAPRHVLTHPPQPVLLVCAGHLFFLSFASAHWLAFFCSALSPLDCSLLPPVLVPTAIAHPIVSSRQSSICLFVQFFLTASGRMSATLLPYDQTKSRKYIQEALWKAFPGNSTPESTSRKHYQEAHPGNTCRKAGVR